MVEEVIPMKEVIPNAAVKVEEPIEKEFSLRMEETEVISRW